jgi:hypothetical protein
VSVHGELSEVFTPIPSAAKKPGFESKFGFSILPAVSRSR